SHDRLQPGPTATLRRSRPDAVSTAASSFLLFALASASGSTLHQNPFNCPRPCVRSVVQPKTILTAPFLAASCGAEMAKKHKSRTPAQPSAETPEAPAPAIEDVPAPLKERHGIPIVGIGASAGGLDAFKRLFSAMPADSGVAFVLIPHLDPKH